MILIKHICLRPTDDLVCVSLEHVNIVYLAKVAVAQMALARIG